MDVKSVIIACAIILVLRIIAEVFIRFFRIKHKVDRSVNLHAEDGGVEIMLRECPFCGKSAVDIEECEVDGTKLYRVRCAKENGGCDCSTTEFSNPLSAAVFWNERSYEED